jgi:transposase-like protein
MNTESEARAMIKCPHCGSTAQPKRVGITSVSANGKYFCENYKCSCGCYFEALYPREVEEYFIHYLEDIEG